MLIRLLSLAELAQQTKRVVKVEEKSLLVILTESEVRITSAICPHRGAPLVEGFIVDGLLICPWHRSIFDTHTGAVIGGPCQQALTTYLPIIRNDYVYIDYNPSAVEP